jgi:hypothetical protein
MAESTFESALTSLVVSPPISIVIPLIRFAAILFSSLEVVEVFLCCYFVIIFLVVS